MANHCSHSTGQVKGKLRSLIGMIGKRRPFLLLTSVTFAITLFFDKPCTNKSYVISIFVMLQHNVLQTVDSN